jgi:hypothetical protein
VALRYLGTLELEARAGVGGTSDAAARGLLAELVRQELLWTRVASETPPLPLADRDSILSALQVELEEIREAVGEGTGAAERVGSYMDAVIARRREALRPPAQLVSEGMAALSGAGSAARSAALSATGSADGSVPVGSGAVAPPTVDPAGVARAVERARRLLQEAGVGEP